MHESFCRSFPKYFSRSKKHAHITFALTSIKRGISWPVTTPAQVILIAKLLSFHTGKNFQMICNVQTNLFEIGVLLHLGLNIL